MDIHGQKHLFPRRRRWWSVRVQQRTPNLLDSVNQSPGEKGEKRSFLWVVGMVVFVGFASMTYGGLQFAQHRYFQSSHVLGESVGMEHGTWNMEQNSETKSDVSRVGIDDVKAAIGLAALGVKAAPYIDFINQLLGSENTVKTYLLVFQNNAEIRPTGGFMGSYAWVRITGGKKVDFGVPGGGFYDLAGSRAVLVEAPKPFQIFSPMEQIWNANWYRDFPESAKRVGWFYVRSGQDSVDGVIAVSPVLLERLLEITGPISLPEFNKTITHENAYQELQTYVEFEYDKTKNQPKEIISVLTSKLFEQLTSLPISDYPRVLGVISDVLNQQHAMMYFQDAELQSFIQSHGWDGRMMEYVDADPSVGSDYVSIVHTNVGGGKTDLVVQTNETVQKTIVPDGTVRTTVTITRSHAGDPSDPLQGLTNIDYVRVYAPKGAKYVSSKGFGELPKELYKDFEAHDRETNAPDNVEHDAYVVESDHTRVVTETYSAVGSVPERMYTSFGNWMIVKPGETVIAELVFDLSHMVETLHATSLRRLYEKLFFQNDPIVYKLVWQKQPGMDTVNQRLRVETPTGFASYLSEGTPADTKDNFIVWNVDSSQNHFFVVGLK